MEKKWIETTRDYILDKNDPYNRDHDNSLYKKKLFLTDEYETISTPKQFKTQLLPHQMVSVKAMIDLEQKRYIKLKIDTSETFKFSDPIAETNAGMLSEHLGSGKTYEILALICLNPVPRSVAEITSINLPRTKQLKKWEFTSRENFYNIGFSFEVRKMYRQFFKQTFIFVGKSVLLQWYKRIQLHTTLKVYVIENIFNLREFYNMIFHPTKELNSKNLEKYDIILIKNGMISGKFDVAELQNTSFGKNKSKPILNVFGELFKNYCIARVVLDDFDNLNIPASATVIPALFTWFVSATKKLPVGKRNNINCYTIHDVLFSYRPTYISIWNNKELFTLFNIGCHDDFINTSTCASKNKYIVYKFNNPNDTYIGLLNAMGSDDARQVMEMLNGDAFKTAADKVGIKSTNVSDIFERILDKKWDIYKKNLLIDKYIPKAKDVISGLPTLSVAEYAITNAKLDQLRKNLRKPGPLSKITSIVEYNQIEVLDTVNDVNQQNKKQKEENGKAIQRVRDNLREGECPITCMPLKEVESIVITKCCNIVMSGEVVSWALKMHTQNNNIVGTCPNCRANIAFDQLIIIDRDINIDSIINEDIELEQDQPQPVQEVQAENDLNQLTDPDPDPDSNDEEVSEKFKCIMGIVMDKITPYISAREIREDILIPGLLEGVYDRGNAPPEKKKIMIYANHRETTQKIELCLNKNNITYAKLYGTTRHIDELVKRYWLPNTNPNSLCVLLLSGPQYCAGLDLQNTTDLIYTHDIVDRNVKEQVAGRAARYGREYNLNIHFVLYHNEYHAMFRNTVPMQQLNRPSNDDSLDSD